MSLVVLGFIAVGALLLGVLFGHLTKRVPNSDGGLYAYSRHEFGDFAGYLVGWCCWIQTWAGNAAIVASWVLYVDSLFGLKHASGMENCVTVVLKFLALLFVGVVGWFFVRSVNLGSCNMSGESSSLRVLERSPTDPRTTQPQSKWSKFRGGASPRDDRPLREDRI